MYLECVVVCVNYSDFLAHTLPYNKNLFDRMVVVTDTKDTKTKELCEYHNVECVQTDEFYHNGNIINKARGINEGLKRLSNKEWVLHLDADIYLPPLTRSILEKLPLRPDTIYGADRLMCPNYESWIKFIEKPDKIQEGWCYVHPTAFPMGVRLAEYTKKGYEVIGYFQLWNPKGSGVYEYPNEHGAIDRSDVLFCKQFERECRQLLPEIITIHLESEGLTIGNMGKNWKGRKTAPFGFDFTVNQLFESRGYRPSCWKRFLLWLKSLFFLY